MAWIRFTQNYDHKWPSRAMSFYDCNKGVDGKGLYNVKRDVADAAIAKGVATMAQKPATPDSNEPVSERLGNAGGVDRSDRTPNGDGALPPALDGRTGER